MPLDHPTDPGDLDHLIADDHAVVEAQFRHLEAGRGDRRILADHVVFELSLHADAEERVLYPALAAAGDPDAAKAAREEHRELKALLAVLNRTDPGDAEFEDALRRVIDETRAHVAEEEARLLPRFRELVGDERTAALGADFLAAKRTAPTYPHPHGPSGATGHRLLDVGAIVVDKVRDRLSGRRVTLATDPSGRLDPQARRLLDAYSGLRPLPPETLTPDLARLQPTLRDAVRAVLTADGRRTDPEPVGAVRTDVVDGGPPVRVYVPIGAGDHPLPVVVWVHGGGWVLHDVDTYDASCRGVANRTNAVVVSPQYRRAPEHPFPAAYEDVLATVRWVRENAAALGADPARIGIGGESVGATMAAATCLVLMAAGERPPVAQVLVTPLVTAAQVGASMADAADARPLNRPLLSWMLLHAFAGAPRAARDPRVDLLSLTPPQLAGMPPALVVTAERDPLRSQGESFADRLIAAGVPTTASRYAGVPHEFFGAAAVLDAAANAQQEAAHHFSLAFSAASV